MAMGTPKAYYDYGGSSTVLPLERYNRTAIFASTNVVRVSTNTIVGPPHKGLSDGAIGGIIAGFLVFLFLLAPASAPPPPHAHRIRIHTRTGWVSCRLLSGHRAPISYPLHISRGYRNTFKPHMYMATIYTGLFLSSPSFTSRSSCSHFPSAPSLCDGISPSLNPRGYEWVARPGTGDPLALKQVFDKSRWSGNS